MTRGHSSHTIVGVVIELFTGLVLDFIVLSNFCAGCERGPKVGDPAYQAWKDNHVCQKNTEKKAGEMEVEAGLILFERSLQRHKLRYTTILSDGGSRTYLALVGAKVYGYIPIKKEDCVNHVKKRMGTNLRNLLAKGTGSASERLGGKGRLTGDLVTKLSSYYGWALKSHSGDVRAMHKAVMATYHHITSNDTVSNHSLCPPGPDSWCRQNAAKAKGEPTPKHRYNLPPHVCEALLPVYERLSDEKLLQRCLQGKTQNSNESLHSMIWALAPKEKHASLFTVQAAVAEAVLKLLTPAAEPVRSYGVEAVAALEANQAVKSFWCCLRLAVHGFLHVILMTAFVLVVFVVLYVCVVRYKAWKDRRQQQVYTLAEQITGRLATVVPQPSAPFGTVPQCVSRLWWFCTAMVKEHAEQPNCKEPFLAQAHVRDMLISPAQRKQLSGVWQAAVAYLERHETQLRAELQQVEGESWMVWRWLGPVSTPRAKVWQGRAFENSQGGASTGAGSSPSVGGLSTYVPATCLKIRNMFDPEVEYESGWARQIENAILEKCEGNTGIVHIHVDTASREGCVYVKCASLDSAGQAYRALHGSWFDGNLITVKYLRLERYHDRFPEARFCHTPMRPSNSLRLSLDRGPSSNPPEDDTL
ncbi:hypothetical protein HPB48_006431 [Haemaphysalis longicornis]|uniref:Uncharacterized protein n=1 Tax=Haemaphysalis longicornis TaxID=44386 RepID=A0A9J6FJT7_HAELO|nr:hypothetical protein HPB48_006431 [Haemaphysalis longicornis]